MEVYTTALYAFIVWTENSTFFIEPHTLGIDNFAFFISLYEFVTEIAQNKVITKFSTLQHALHRCMPRVTLI